jgi:HD-GYP domain-containing protein (c-di-GMP phosphodiesterase class II)
VLQQAVGGVEELLQAVARNAPFSMARAEHAAELLLQSLERGDTLLLPFFTVGGASTSPARKAVNVCILSVKMGMELGYVPEELQRLGVAALLCDAAMAQLSRKPGPQQWLAEVAERRHRKAADPRRLADRLDEYAAIIRLADTYETLVHSRPFRHPIGPLEALGEILQQERTSFPDGILKALIRALSAFPVGSLVRLNTGEIGRVVARNANFPLRPVVEVLVRGERWLETPLTVDMSQNPLQHIQDSVAEEALP